MIAGATSTKSKITFLETVYPPISNQEAVWLQNDPEGEALLRQSDFYMIGGRAEAKYLNLVVDPATYVATFDFAIGDDFHDPVEIRIRDLPAVQESEVGFFWIEAAEKLIRVWDGPIAEPGSNVLEWFTTEKLIWDRSRGRAGTRRFDRHREAATYDLLYVGIAKVSDSFDRLISNGHKAPSGGNRLLVVSGRIQFTQPAVLGSATRTETFADLGKRHSSKSHHRFGRL